MDNFKKFNIYFSILLLGSYTLYAVPNETLLAVFNWSVNTFEPLFRILSGGMLILLMEYYLLPAKQEIEV